MILRDVAGSGTGLGEERNGAQVQVAGGVGRGLADSLGDGEMASPLLAALGELAFLDVQLGIDDDARHHGDGFDRVLAYC